MPKKKNCEVQVSHGFAFASHFKQKANCTERDLKHHINGVAQVLNSQSNLKEEKPNCKLESRNVSNTSEQKKEASTTFTTWEIKTFTLKDSLHIHTSTYF